MGKGRHRNNKDSKLPSTTSTLTTKTPTLTPTLGYTKVVTPPKRTEITTMYTPTLILTDAFMAKVSYLHAQVKRGLEWSAILLYTNKQGSVDSANNWVISVDDLILMDIGSPGYTEYDMGADDPSNEIWMDHLEKGGKIGHLHTHHSMDCFFSGTDMGELHDNAPNHNYYLSLIVNYKDITNWCAMVAICGTETTEGTLTTTKSWKGAKGLMSKKEEETLTDVKETLYLMKCKLTPESDTHVPEGLQSRLIEIQAKKAAAPTTPYVSKYRGGSEQPVIPFSSGVVSLGNGTTQKLGSTSTTTKPHVPFSAPGTFPFGEDEFGDEQWAGLYDTNGNIIPQVSSNKPAKASITNRYSPKVCAPILAKIIAQDIESTISLQEAIMALEGQEESKLELYMDECAEHFLTILDATFPEELTANHLHAIAVAMYFELDNYQIFSAYEVIDAMVSEYLLEEGEFNASVIRTMTGVPIADQICLERTEK